MTGNIGFQSNLTSQVAERTEPGDPFRLLVLCDLGVGSGSSSVAGFAGKRPLEIDVDVLPGLMARLTPETTITVSGSEAPITITVASLDDFHPDRLFQRLPFFAPWRDLRDRLKHPATFAAAAAELEAMAARPTTETAPEKVPDPATSVAPREDISETMARLLGQPAPSASSAPPTSTGTPHAALAALLQSATAGQVVRTSGADQDLYLAALDERIAAIMREVLHHPNFQRLEATWRMLAWLVSSVPTGEDLTVHVLDASRADLVADVRIAASSDLSHIELYRLLAQETVGIHGAARWSLIAVDLTLGAGGEDIALGAALAALGAAADAPVIANASPGLLGCESLAASPDPREWPPLAPEAAKRWQALRTFEHAGCLGLALPRVLLRQPYGERGDPIDSFAFEELRPGADHEAFLWGSPALAVAMLCTLASLGGDDGGGAGRSLDDLPAHVVLDAHGEQRLQPCAEVLLSDRAAEAIDDQGLMALVSHARQPSVLLPRVRSIALGF